MSGAPLNAAHEELNGLFERTQAALDPWASEPQGFKGGFGSPDWTPNNNDDDF